MFTTILIGAAIGAAVAVGVIAGAFKVQTKESWKESCQSAAAARSCVYALAAENAKLRLSLAAGAMTEDGRKVAAMAMAALDAVKTAAAQAVLGSDPGPVASRNPASSPEGKQ